MITCNNKQILIITSKDLPILVPDKISNVKLKNDSRIYLMVKVHQNYDEDGNIVFTDYQFSLRLGKRGKRNKKRVYFTHSISVENIELPEYAVSGDMFKDGCRVSFQDVISLIFSKFVRLIVTRNEEEIEFQLEVCDFWIRSIVKIEEVSDYFFSRPSLHLVTEDLSRKLTEF